MNNFADTDVLIPVSCLWIFFRYIQLNGEHRTRMDTGHAVHAAVWIPDTFVPIHMKTMFRTDPGADLTANAFLRDPVEIAEQVSRHFVLSG